MTWQKPESSRYVKLETARSAIQTALDAERSAKERNSLGQFATPPTLAEDIVNYSLKLHSGDDVHFLEPSCGSGSFYSALLRSMRDKKLASARGVELDERFAAAADHLWRDEGLHVISGDFTDRSTLPEFRASLLIANPPYVRHHHLTAGQKQHLLAETVEQTEIKPSGLSGLYIYFVLLSHRLLAPGAISAWLIPNEFMDVNYGSSLKQYLSKHVTLRRIHKFDPADIQFNDALVTSAVVIFENVPPKDESVAEFTFGGSVSNVRERILIPCSGLKPKEKWSRYFNPVREKISAGPVLADFFRIRRGIATGANSFFIKPKAEALALGINPIFLRPILPSPRYLKQLVVGADRVGYPLLDDQLVLIDCALSEANLESRDPALYAYLQSASTTVRKGYLVRQRSPWYKQEKRSSPPFLCTYMGRSVDENRPFKFIWNQSEAVATNLYLLLYPIGTLADAAKDRPEILKAVHNSLLSLTADDLRNGGRVYGGGLHKIEPKELAQLRAASIAEVLREFGASGSEQLSLV